MKAISSITINHNAVTLGSAITRPCLSCDLDRNYRDTNLCLKFFFNIPIIFFYRLAPCLHPPAAHLCKLKQPFIYSSQFIYQKTVYLRYQVSISDHDYIESITLKTFSVVKFFHHTAIYTFGLAGHSPTLLCFSVSILLI